MERKIKFVCNAVRWFDKVNGNTYHSVRVTRCSDGKVIVGQFQYGYGDSYRQTALEEIEKASWLPKKYTGKIVGGYGGNKSYSYERENNYPILWNISDDLKRECVANGIL